MTALPSVIAVLQAMFEEATGVPVYDGPQPTGADDMVFVLVGSTGEDDEDSATLTLDRSSLGNKWTDESGSVTCSAWAGDGDGDLTSLRAVALTLMQTCKAAVDGEPTLGGVLSSGHFASVTDGALRQQQNKQGAVARVTFTVSYSSLLTV